MDVDGPRFHSHLAHQRVKLGVVSCSGHLSLLLPSSRRGKQHLPPAKLKFVSVNGKQDTYVAIEIMHMYVSFLESTFTNHTSSGLVSFFYYWRGHCILKNCL